jgi:hypothetical protein
MCQLTGNSTYCEKQIDASSNTFLYCSESYVLRSSYSLPTSANPSRRCRQHDLSTHSATTSHQSSKFSPPQMHVPFSSSSHYTSPPRSPYSSTFYQTTDGPDIIPRASPSIARPRSYFGSEPLAAEETYGSGYGHVSSSLPQQFGYAPGSSRDGGRKDEHRKSSTALASLRELSSALESSRSYSKPSKQPNAKLTKSNKSNSSIERERAYRGRNASSDSSSGSTYSGSSEGETDGGDDEYELPQKSHSKWSYAPTPGVFARTYSTPAPITQSAYQLTGKSYGGTGGYSYAAGMKGMERPLPPRSVGFGHRPKSIDLVTPFGVGN